MITQRLMGDLFARVRSIMLNDLIDTIRAIAEHKGLLMSDKFPEEAGYKYRYYTDMWRLEQGLTQEQMVNFIHRATTWVVVGYDAARAVTVCRRPISSIKDG